MRRFNHYFVLSLGFLLCVFTVSDFNHPRSVRKYDHFAEPIAATSPPENQSSSEVLLSDTENAYNPVPSPDGSMIAYVRTGWDRPGGSGGTGRSNLVSEVSVMDSSGHVLTKKPLADAFLQGWTHDGRYLICSRDYNYSIASVQGNVLLSGRLPALSDFREVSERVSYLSSLDSVIWFQNDYRDVKRTKISRGSESLSRDLLRSALTGSHGEIARFRSQYDDDVILIPSPNENYIAVIGRHYMDVYDLQEKTWTSFGEIIIHPDEDWDYIKPTWNPWFADSSKLAFLNATGIVISSPDGKSRQTILKPPGKSGLVTPSPDGNFIAFATFESRPMAVRSDLKFWGGSTIWIAPVVTNSTPRPVTQKNQDTTFDLRWLNEHSLVFDRIADEPEYKKARLWKVDVLR